MRLDAQAIHAALGPDGWRQVLLDAGFTERQLAKKNGPCPVCGGADRYHFDNKHGRGDYYCRRCGANDGFHLLMGAKQIHFADARKLVMHLAGLRDSDPPPIVQNRPTEPEPIAGPTERVRKLMRESCRIEDCEPARRYLESRKLWPLPKGHGLRAHPSVAYWHEQQQVGRFPALLGAVRDVAGELVTAHATYLTRQGEKLSEFEPRKLLSPMTGRDGCAVSLMPHAEVLGIAEGIETALSASSMHNLPVWAALNTALLAKWTPPKSVGLVVIFADRDVPGLEATAKLMERLQGRVSLSCKVPPRPKDWNDMLRSAA